MIKPHKCEALVISCIDFRFITKVRDFLIKKGLKESYDLITVPGASLNLDKIAAYIITSLDLHKPSKIYIFDHEDCGAYGENNSGSAHIKNLKKTKKLILQGNPEKQVKTFIAHLKSIKEIN